MRRRYKKNVIYAVTAIMLLAASWDARASQTGDKLKDAGKKIDELQQQKENAKDKVGSLQKEQTNLKGELAEFNGQLSDVSARINDLEAQMKEKRAAIEEASQNLSDTEALRAEQYERMKLRIQYIYENGGADFAAVLLNSSSLADFLNRAEYVEEINRYDRQMLHNYEETCKQIAEKKQHLQTEEEELAAMQQDLEQKEDEVKSLIAKTQQGILAKQNEISDAQKEVEEYDAQIAKMKAYEEELERKKAEEARRQAAERKRIAEQKKKEEEQGKKPGGEQSQNQGGGSVTANASDLAMLAALVECEAGGESYEGQWAVASVVVNRVRSGSFPNTVSGVIYQGGQFTPVASGRFAVVLAKGAAASCTQAARAALSGSTNVNFLYFCRASSGVEGTVIGNHVFY